MSDDAESVLTEIDVMARPRQQNLIGTAQAWFRSCLDRLYNQHTFTFGHQFRIDQGNELAILSSIEDSRREETVIFKRKLSERERG